MFHIMVFDDDNNKPHNSNCVVMMEIHVGSMLHAMTKGKFSALGSWPETQRWIYILQ